jgi:hypothetical protein
MYTGLKGPRAGVLYSRLLKYTQQVLQRTIMFAPSKDGTALEATSDRKTGHSFLVSFGFAAINLMHNSPLGRGISLLK